MTVNEWERYVHTADFVPETQIHLLSSMVATIIYGTVKSMGYENSYANGHIAGKAEIVEHNGVKLLKFSVYKTKPLAELEREADAQ